MKRNFRERRGRFTMWTPQKLAGLCHGLGTDTPSRAWGATSFTRLGE